MSINFDELFPKNLPKFKVTKSMTPMKINLGGTDDTSQPASEKSSAQENIIRIPVGNRYCGHEDLIARIAKDIVNEAFSPVKPVSWSPVSRSTVVREYELKLSIEQETISMTCIWGRESISNALHFIDYGRKQLPDVDGFASAIEPFIKKYADDAGNRVFANIDKLSSYSIKCYRDTFYGTPIISVVIKQVLHPDNNLKSW